MNYFSIVLISLILMLLISGLMYMLGRKISYNYILYNASISLGVGVIFFLCKMIFFEGRNSIERVADIGITVILLFIWLVALTETIFIEIMENGKEYKTSIRKILAQIKNMDIKTIKSFPITAYRFGKELILKIKDISFTYKIKVFLLKRYKKMKERF